MSDRRERPRHCVLVQRERDSPSTLHRRLKYYVRMSVIAIDELGYLSYDQRATDLLFEIVKRRHEAGMPVLISTNLAFREWGTVFPHVTVQQTTGCAPRPTGAIVTTSSSEATNAATNSRAVA